ncbi:MAG: hypothetical protein ACRD96_29350, partial [Bryobacteraceae bacterium]
TRPEFATFFTNHVASSMHRFWAAAFPSDYGEFGYTPEWVATYRDEIRFTMSHFEGFFRRLAAFVDANADYQLWIASSMGQAATETQPVETQLYAGDLDLFLGALGFGPQDWTRCPAMLPQYNVRVVPEKADEFRRTVARVRLFGEPLAWRENTSFFSLDLGQRNQAHQPPVMELDGRRIPFAECGLKHVEIEEKSGANAYHIPEGALLVYDPRDPRQRVRRSRLSTVEIAPSILRNYGIAAPSYMETAALV